MNKAKEWEEKKKAENKMFLAFVNGTVDGRKCPVCAQTGWGLVEGVFKLVDENGGGGGILEMFTRSLPVVCCCCETCGYIMTFSAQFVRNMHEKAEQEKKTED